MNRHKLLDKVSLAWHTAISNKLARDPTLVKIAIGNLDRWRDQRGYEERAYAEWRRILTEEGTDEIIRILSSDSHESDRLRQSTPFTGILTQAERREISEATRS